jgi:hypothetical protein
VSGLEPGDRVAAHPEFLPVPPTRRQFLVNSDRKDAMDKTAVAHAEANPTHN